MKRCTKNARVFSQSDNDIVSKGKYVDDPSYGHNILTLAAREMVKESAGHTAFFICCDERNTENTGRRG